MSYARGGVYSPNGVTIHPWSHVSIGDQLRVIAANPTGGNSAWPAANLALYVPFALDEPFIIREVFWNTGTVTGGNLDIGVYSADTLAKVFSTGSLSRGTASALNSSTTVTDTLLIPGQYYLAISADGTNSYAASVAAAGLHQSCGIMEQSTAFPLPATATPVATTRGFLPMFGLNGTTVAL